MLGVIDFTGPAISADDGGIAFRAKVDGLSILCRFRADCLEDVNPSLRVKSPLE